MDDSLYDMAVFGDFDGVKRLVNANAIDVNQTDDFGFTALHVLAEEEYPEIAEFLIQNGANVNMKNEDGITPLHLAGWPEIAKLFLLHGADLEARSNDGRTPLLVLAAEQESEDVIERDIRLSPKSFFISLYQSDTVLLPSIKLRIHRHKYKFFHMLFIKSNRG